MNPPLERITRLGPAEDEQSNIDTAVEATPLRICGAELYCPIAPKLNPRHEQAERDSLDWVWSHQLVRSRDELDRFASFRVSELISRAYPYAPMDRLRIVMDWTLWVFLTDDHLDDTSDDFASLAARYESYKRILRGEQDIAELTGPYRALASVRSRLAECGEPSCTRRFAEQAGGWFDSLLWERRNKDRGVTPTIRQYMRMREITVGLYTEYALFDITHEKRTDEAFWTDPDLLYLQASSSNLVAWSNDIFSYAKESALDDPHNLLRLFEKHVGLDHDRALRRVTAMYNKEMIRFVESEQQLRHRETDGLHVDDFVGMLKNWIRAHLDWSFGSARYAGRAGE